MSKVNLFVYGTLMSNKGELGFNDHFGLVDAAEDVKYATALGEMYNRQGEHPMYPCVDFDGLNEIMGQVFIGIDESTVALRQADRMERGAGYEVRTIRVQLDEEDGEVECRAYHFPVEEIHVGVRIDSGSWNKFMQEAYR